MSKFNKIVNKFKDFINTTPSKVMCKVCNDKGNFETSVMGTDTEIVPCHNCTNREIKNCGFLDSDYLSTMLINRNNGILYVFNYGNYGRTWKFIMSISMESDSIDIEDWICNRLRDENMDVDSTVKSISIIKKSDVRNTKILSEYKDEEIGNDVLMIKFKIN